jgi:hypothetical protein
VHQFSPAVGGIDDIQLVRRVRQAYKAAHATFSDYGESQWGTLDSWKSAIHSLVVRGTDDDLTDALRNPATTELFYGFDLIGASRTQALNNDSGFRDHQAMLGLMRLKRLLQPSVWQG